MGRRHSPPQTSPPVGRGHPLPLLTPLGASIIAPLALDLWPHQTEILAMPLIMHCIRLAVRRNVRKELISL